jgi:hypothetical protein
MAKALADMPIEEPIRLALRGLFERSSTYVVNSGRPLKDADAPQDPAGNIIEREMAQRWEEQRALDDLLGAIRDGNAARAIELTRTPTLECRFARDRSVLAHVLALMMGSRNEALLAYAEREVQSDRALAQVRTRYGRTLLHDASAQGNARVVELLLRQGADPNARTSGGHTPLYCVANECRDSGAGNVVRALAQAGAHVDARSDAKQCTALHMAARRGNTEIAEALVDCGADINARDKAGDTPLRRARNCRKPETVSLLLSRGAVAP